MMHADEITAALQNIVRNQLRDCEEAIRSHDPVRALNEVDDAKQALQSLIRRLGTNAETPST